jgi:hypothetical protein
VTAFSSCILTTSSTTDTTATATASIASSCDDGTSTDVETQNSASTSSSNIDACDSTTSVQHGTDAPIIQAKLEAAKVSDFAVVDNYFFTLSTSSTTVTYVS